MDHIVRVRTLAHKPTIEVMPNTPVQKLWPPVIAEGLHKQSLQMYIRPGLINKRYVQIQTGPVTVTRYSHINIRAPEHTM